MLRRDIESPSGARVGGAGIENGRAAVWLVLAAVLSVTWAPDAFANGRFPRAQRLLEDPNDAAHLTLAATFGLLTTSDRGAHWYHVCEAGFAGDDTYSGDPLLERVADGALLVDVQSSMRRSVSGCEWTTVLGPPAVAATATIDDFAVDRVTGATVVAVATELVDGGERATLLRSLDAGVTWAAVGRPLPVSTAFTVDLDPTDPSHIYATGLSSSAERAGVFLESTDGGMTWTSIDIPNTDSSSAPFIAAVHPRDPHKIFIRTDGWASADGADEDAADDALLYSSDSGRTWTQVLRKAAKLLGFAISPDGDTVIAGYGDPTELGRSVVAADMGVYRASIAEMQFSQSYSGNDVTCLTWTQAGIYVCTERPESGTYEELAVFAPATFLADGAPTSLMRLGDVQGPLPCCAAAERACPWQSVCSMFDACGIAAPEPVCDGGPPAAMSETRAPATTGLDGGAGELPLGKDATPAASSGGCRLAKQRHSKPQAEVFAVAVVAAIARRRRRRILKR